MDGRETLPLRDRLVINQDIGLGKEAPEAIFDSKLLRDATSILGANRAPAVELGTRAGEFLYLVHNIWNGNRLGTCRADQRIVDIDVHNKPSVCIHECVIRPGIR